MWRKIILATVSVLAIIGVLGHAYDVGGVLGVVGTFLLGVLVMWAKEK